MSNLISKIKSSSLVKDTAKLATGNILLYILPFVVTPILSRLYDPSFFGEWGVFSSTYQIFNCILFLCYDYVIIKAEEDEYANVCALSFIVSIFVLFFATIIFLIGNSFGFTYFENFQWKHNLFILLLFTSISHILLHVANRQKRYWLMSYTNLTLGFLQALVRILLGLYIIFPNGLITGTTIAQFLSMLFICFCMRKTLNKSFFQNIKYSKIITVAKKYKNFPLYEAPATLLLFCTFNLSLIILSFYFKKDDIGCLSIIHQMLVLPISLIGSAMGKVYYKQITDSDYKSEVETSIKMIKIVLIISLLPALFIVAGGDHIINIFLGSKWENAGKIAICMAIWSVPNVLTQPLTPIFRKRNKQYIMLITYITNFIMGIGSIFITCSFHLDIYTVLFLYSICCAITNYGLFIYILRLTNVNIRLACKPFVIVFHILLVVLIFSRFNVI